ncbi:hypothetical protein [Streptomyces decoyicus]|uniref:hypothetical protein n=1 Tax=Streptomyces decoyicus TaxID=249567 RepID=UPI00069DD54C|nr:hypothetical protein [Streptomyces decoyicus]KOG38025.1 membrane protein [Streptomyces decoyicus]QZY14301.1 hypothetical protein K7C20_02815 [Streptomyces decoyicus]
MTASVRKRECHRDLWAAAGAVALFVLAAVVGRVINRAVYGSEGILRLGWPPLYAWWLPHVGPGTPVAVAVAAAVVVYGPSTAQRLSWRVLVPAVWTAAMAWTWSLALVDGWSRGVAERLTTSLEYLQSVDDVHDVGAFLRDFTHHILVGSPGIWPAHVAGHPPGALLTFVGLDRIGLGGGAWAAVWCLTVGSSLTAAVMVTVRALSGEELARRAASFLVLAPAAVWIGVSADGYFAGVAAWAIALLALAATRSTRVPRLTALGAGLLLGWAWYLSYGLTVLVVLGAAVLLLARSVRPLPYVLLGVLVWAAAFTSAGFWWLDGYTTLVERYYQGAAKVRPYSYFLWANLAAQLLTVGLATVAGLRRAAGPLWHAVRRMRREPPSGREALAVLVAAGLCMMLLADVSGMSKAETERIWLSFAVWTLPASALLPRRVHSWWLAAQALLALLVNHLLLTGW